MRQRDIKSANRNAYGRDSRGHLGTCNYCGRTVYWWQPEPDMWRAFESWAAGTVDQDEWELHDCNGKYSETSKYKRGPQPSKSKTANQQVICPKCHIINSARVKECLHCGYTLK